MRKLFITCLMIWTPTLGMADGPAIPYDDPEVVKPASPTWTGFYTGAKVARDSETTETTECFKLGQPRACDDPIFDQYPEFKEVVTTSASSSSTKGAAFAGYRYDFDPLVLGIEASSDPTIELQAGVGLGRVLIYGVAGTGEDDEFYGAGVDALLGNRLLLGVKHTTDETSLRIGIKF